MRRFLLVALAFIGLGAPVQAADYQIGALEVTSPWARETAPTQANGAAYLTVVNRGEQPDRLVAAGSDVAGQVELHTHMVDAQGVARMRPVQAVELPAGGEAKLQPGGMHVMLIGLRQPLAKGTSFPLVLRFERAGELQVEVEVESVRGAAAHDAHQTH